MKNMGTATADVIDAGDVRGETTKKWVRAAGKCSSDALAISEYLKMV
jgi:hypothetical protein